MKPSAFAALLRLLSAETKIGEGDPKSSHRSGSSIAAANCTASYPRSLCFPVSSIARSISANVTPIKR